MDELSTALRGLAAEAHASAGPDASVLWADGRRRARRRRAGASAAVVVVALLAGALALVVPRPSPPPDLAPAQTSHAPAVPRDVWSPPASTSTTTQAGPPGVVAVLGGASRSDGTGLFTISATTGEYRLLDLPDAFDATGVDTAPALAPDGRRIAYWLAGSPSGEPILDDLAAPDSAVTVGIGVYDTRTGAVLRFQPGTEHGLAVEPLQWADDDTLLVGYGQLTSPSASEPFVRRLWDVARTPTPDRTVSGLGGEAGRALDGRLLQTRGGGKVVDLTHDGGRAAVVARLPRSRTFAASAAWLSPRAAVLPGNEVSDGGASVGSDRTMVAAVGAGGRVGRLIPVRSDVAVTPLGWIDERRMLVIGPGRSAEEWGSLARLDALTGRLTPIGTAQAGIDSPGLTVATDLLRSPMVDGVRPPSDDGPRWTVGVQVSGLALLAGLLLTGGVALVRRRRRE